MSRKEELNKEDLEFLKDLLGSSKKEENNASEYKKPPEKVSISSIKEGLLELDKSSKIFKHVGNIDSEIGKSNLLNSQDQKKSIKKRKIKKKQLFLEVAEALPLIKQNNILLNELIQVLTQDPIKIKLLK